MKNRFLRLALSALCVLSLTACSTVYAANGKPGDTKEKEPQKETPADANAQEAFNIFREALRNGDFANTGRTVTVSSSASVGVVPDKVEISFGVVTQAKTAEKAQQENSETINKVIDQLMEMGVEEKSIQTSGYNLYPDYDYSGDTRKLLGYQVSTMLTVRDQEMDDAGKIVSECVKLGINDVNNFRFYASSYDDAYEEALQKAVAAAERKAEVLAESAGCVLGKVTEIKEGWQDTSTRYAKSNVAMETAAMDEAAVNMSLMPGETQITAQVTVTYMLK